jgi:hypothetical protein
MSRSVATTGCRPCDQDWEHCHDTLIVHVDGRIECAEPSCRHGRFAHVFVVACTEITRGCCVDDEATP